MPFLICILYVDKLATLLYSTNYVYYKVVPFVYIFGLIDRFFEHPVIKDHTNYKFSWFIIGYIL